MISMFKKMYKLIISQQESLDKDQIEILELRNKLRMQEMYLIEHYT